jgi:hypothetical protein
VAIGRYTTSDHTQLSKAPAGWGFDTREMGSRIGNQVFSFFAPNQRLLQVFNRLFTLSIVLERLFCTFYPLGSADSLLKSSVLLQPPAGNIL